MDYVEFRDDGTVLGLVAWPPDDGTEIRLNATAKYSILDGQQVAFVGACRNEDPCTGVYSVTLSGDKMRAFSEDGELELRRVGPTSETLPPTIVGPSASPTPGANIPLPAGERLGEGEDQRAGPWRIPDTTTSSGSRSALCQT
jgi:hypothetical protein